MHQEIDFQKIRNLKTINDQEFNVNLATKLQQTQNRHIDADANDLRPIPISNLKCKLKNETASGNDNGYYELQILLQLKLSSFLNSYKFLCLKLRPIYLAKDTVVAATATPTKSGQFESKFYKNFFGIFMLLTTQQDGFLYFVSPNKYNTDSCISFPFTSQLLDVAMDDTTVQALTENGLEVYTIGNKFLSELFKRNNYSVTNKSVCLIGLRPFLSVHKILLGEKNLVLFAKAAEGPSSETSTIWTIYNLLTPTASAIYRDFEELAKKKYG